jgi:hypothetical protein
MTLIAAGLLPRAAAQSLTVTVDCSEGQTIAQALKQGDSRKPLDVIVRGTCSEYVTIARSDVTLRGESIQGSVVSGPGTAAPAVLIQADRVNLEQITVTGGANGVVLSGPFVASMTGVVVREPSSGSAVLVRAGGDLSVSGCTLAQANIGLQLQRGGSARAFNGTEIRDNGNAGVFAGVNSTVNVSGGSKVIDNGGHGIEVQSGSQANISNSEIANNGMGVLIGASGASIVGNLIHNNREHGVLAQAGAVVSVDQNEIRENSRDGVVGYLGATVVMHGNEITDNGETGVSCRSNCTLQISGERITGNGYHGLAVQLRSTLIVEGPVTDATGNGWVDLWCGDTESSADGLAEYFIGSTEGCTDFNN